MNSAAESIATAAKEAGCFDDRMRLIHFVLGVRVAWETNDRTTPTNRLSTPVKTTGTPRSSSSETFDDSVGGSRCPLTGTYFTNRSEYYSSIEHANKATSVCQARCRDSNHSLKMLRFFMACADDRKGPAKLPRQLKEDPHLILARSTACSRLMPIGWTALHVAASQGAAKSCRILLANGANPFERDLTGRTPLHLVAASEKKKKGHLSVCEQLLDAMRRTSGRSVVGIDAPVDLAGLTPSAWLLASSSKDPKHLGYVERLKERIHTPGDRSISPFTSRARPASMRRKQPTSMTHGHAELPGWRLAMEDATALHPRFDPERSTGLFGIFDGHGGCATAKFCAEHLASTLRESEAYAKGNAEAALRKVALTLDAKLSETRDPQDSGAVGIFVLVSPDRIVAANVGDARVVLARRDGDAISAVPLTSDHKTSVDPAERARVLATGATLTATGRVKMPGEEQQSLAVSRAFGDFFYKSESCRAVIAEPTVRTRSRDKRDLFLVLACDGVWDVMSNDECVAFVDEALRSSGTTSAPDLDRVASRLLFKCLEKGSQDNMSAAIVLLNGTRSDDDDDDDDDGSCGRPAEMLSEAMSQLRVGGDSARKSLFAS